MNTEQVSWGVLSYITLNKIKTIKKKIINNMTMFFYFRINFIIKILIKIPA